MLDEAQDLLNKFMGEIRDQLLKPLLRGGNYLRSVTLPLQLPATNSDPLHFGVGDDNRKDDKNKDKPKSAPI